MIAVDVGDEQLAHGIARHAAQQLDRATGRERRTVRVDREDIAVVHDEHRVAMYHRRERHLAWLDRGVDTRNDHLQSEVRRARSVRLRREWRDERERENEGELEGCRHAATLAVQRVVLLERCC